MDQDELMSEHSESENDYIKSRINGVYIKYDCYDRPILECEYYNGKRNGSYYEYDYDYISCTEISYEKQLIRSFYYIDGKLEGLAITNNSLKNGDMCYYVNNECLKCIEYLDDMHEALVSHSDTEDDDN
jgi:hypothetical protein